MPLLLLIVTGCSLLDQHGDDDAGSPSRPTPSTTVPDVEVCVFLEVPLEYGVAEDPSFAELIEDIDKDDQALGAMVALAFMTDTGSPARFRPALRHLAELWEADSQPGGPRPPDLTDAIRENARELDRFLADGGCG